MKPYRAILLTALLLIPASMPGISRADNGGGNISESGSRAHDPYQPFEPGELIVKFRKEVAQPSRASSHQRNRGSVLKRFSRLNADHVRFPPDLPMEQVVRDYSHDPTVEYVEPNFRIYSSGSKPAPVPTDPDFQEQWYFKNTGQTGGTPLADIDAVEAWKNSTGSRDVIVAVIDSGVTYMHEDLNANMWVNRLEIPGNGMDDDQNGYVDDVYGIDTYGDNSNPDDVLGHGTHIAGIIGAAGDNSVGVTGINWEVQVLACKFLGPWGYGSISGAIECLEYVRALYERGENIVATNNSWGFSGFSHALYDAVSQLPEMLHVAAAGNGWRDTDRLPYYPASLPLPNVIAVASTDHNDDKAPSSNFGRRTVHIGAPGVDIYNTLPEHTHWGASFYGYLSGTSMAAPQVAGLAALIKADKPSRSWSNIRNLVLAGGEPIASMQEITVTGRRISASQSLDCKQSRVFSVLEVPGSIVPEEPVVLSALNINCEQPGPFVLVAVGEGEFIELHDDGLWPDLAKHDGIFSVEWFPAEAVDSLRFFSNKGLEETVFLE